LTLKWLLIQWPNDTYPDTSHRTYQASRERRQSLSQVEMNSIPEFFIASLYPGVN